MSQVGVPLVGFYDHRLVALSIFTAIFASYAALDLGGRITAAHGWIRSSWLAGGAAAMGTGTWSMHFTGMLAFSLPVPVAYHWPTVLLSLLAAMLLCKVCHDSLEFVAASVFVATKLMATRAKSPHYTRKTRSSVNLRVIARYLTFPTTPTSISNHIHTYKCRCISRS